MKPHTGMNLDAHFITSKSLGSMFAMLKDGLQNKNKYIFICTS